MFAGDPQIIHKNRLNPGMIFGQDRKCHRQGVGGEGPALYGFEENGEYHGISRSWSKNVQNAILLRNVAILLGYPTLGNAKNVTNPASDGLTFQKSRSNQGYDILFQKKIVRMATDGYSIRRLSVLNNWWVDNFEPTICD